MAMASHDAEMRPRPLPHADACEARPWSRFSKGNNKGEGKRPVTQKGKSKSYGRFDNGKGKPHGHGKGKHKGKGKGKASPTPNIVQSISNCLCSWPARVHVHCKCASLVFPISVLAAKRVCSMHPPGRKQLCLGPERAGRGLLAQLQPPFAVHLADDAACGTVQCLVLSHGPGARSRWRQDIMLDKLPVVGTMLLGRTRRPGCWDEQVSLAVPFSHYDLNINCAPARAGPELCH